VKKLKLKSFEESSILVKFNIFFFLFAIIPLCVLMYLYYQLKVEGEISLSPEDLNTALIIVVLGVVSGYIAMRALLKNLIDITSVNAERLRSYMDPQQIQQFLKGDENEIAVLTRTFREITSRLEDNVQNLELTKKTLHSVLTRVGHGISHLRNIDTFLDLIVETTTEALSGRKGILFLLDDEKKNLCLKTAHGMAGEKIEKTVFPIEKSPFAPVLYARTALIIPKMQYSENLSPSNEIHFDYPMICAPLLLKDRVLGVIAVSGRKMGSTFQEEEMSLLFNLASQTAVALENASLSADAGKTYFETLSALAMAVEAKDPYSRGHLDRVAKISVAIALDLGLSPEEVGDLRDAARIHDVGKIGVTDDVLSKPAPLSDQEWVMMKRHPEIGESIIRPVSSLKQLCDMVRHHHEKLDGSGYPDGLKEADISRSVRILAIADIYDALTTDRPYRKAMLHVQAMKTMRDMGNKIDQSVVDTVERVM
jgi:hypothetical protein